jgi:hypothetical protein
MWIRRTHEEVIQRRRRHWLFASLFYSTLAFVCIFVSCITGYRKHSTHPPLTWTTSLFYAILVSLLTAVIVYFAQAVLGWKFTISDRVMICSNCHRVTSASEKKRCACGGVLDEFDDWKWDEGDLSKGENDE